MLGAAMSVGSPVLGLALPCKPHLTVLFGGALARACRAHTVCAGIPGLGCICVLASTRDWDPCQGQGSRGPWGTWRLRGLKLTEQKWRVF